MRLNRITFCLFCLLIACGEDKPAAFTQEGEASYYARVLAGNKTSSGATYQPDKLTAAHRYLPLGTVVQVTNLGNGKKISVEINDRGPYVGSRILDLSRAAADSLGMIEGGTARVKLEVSQAAEGYSIADSIAEDRLDDYKRRQGK